MSKAVLYAMEPAYLQAYIDHKNEISAAVASGKVSAEMIDRVKAEMSGYHDENKKCLYEVDPQGVAHINVAGPLEPKADPCAVMFDLEMTTYSDIIEATRKAEDDPMVVSLLYHFSSPGGNVVGLFRAADEVYKAKKPTAGIIHSLCASAAYAIASQCDRLDAENISVEAGSIGVKTEIVDFSGADKEQGVKRYILTSENAEDKNPDVTKVEGRDKIIARLTDMESVFIDYVARGRNVTREKILSDFGRGGVLIAEKALQANMIDGIITNVKTLSTETPSMEPGEIDTKCKPKNKASIDSNATSQPIQKETETMAGEITMTKEQLDEFAANVATKTAASVTGSLTADFEKKEQARAADETRKAGFKPLYEKFPEQKALIDAEVAKEGATASAAFAITVAEAETARLSALASQTGATSEKAKPLSGDSKKADTSGDEFLASMGVTAKQEA